MPVQHCFQKGALPRGFACFTDLGGEAVNQSAYRCYHSLSGANNDEAEAEVMNAVFDDQTRFFRLLFDQLFDGFVVIDRTGKIVLANQALCRLLGGKEEDFLGRHMTEVVSPKATLHLVAQGVLPAVIGGRIRVRGHEFVTKLIPIRIDGEIVGAAGMAMFSDSEQAMAFARRLVPSQLEMAEGGREWRPKYTLHDIVGNDPAVERVRSLIQRAAAVNGSVLISGETGTGKELVAHAIHALSSRAKQPFVRLNCSAVPGELIEPELFGYEGGAFTGARTTGNMGKFEIANNGTIFLDEIGDMPLNAQTALLRVLQEREIVRVGGRAPIPLNVRVICATNRNLLDMVRQGSFRQDLFYRLDVLQIRLPAVRERNDFSLLLEHLIERTRMELGLEEARLPPAVLRRLSEHSWPGNVREMRNAVERLLVDYGTSLPTTPHALESRWEEQNISVQEVIRMPALKELSASTEREAIVHALRSAAGNVSKAARLLGISRPSLHKKLKRHNINKRVEV